MGKYFIWKNIQHQALKIVQLEECVFSAWFFYISSNFRLPSPFSICRHKVTCSQIQFSPPHCRHDSQLRGRHSRDKVPLRQRKPDKNLRASPTPETFVQHPISQTQITPALKKWNNRENAKVEELLLYHHYMSLFFSIHNMYCIT